MTGYVFLGIVMFVLGLVLGILLEFDWKEYYRYKIQIVELGMKYEKEARNEQSNISN